MSLLLRHHELTNENVSKAREKRLGDEVQRFIFSNRPIETKTFTDLKATKKPVKPVTPTKNSTRPYLNEILAHFIHEIKTKGYDDIGDNVFLRKKTE